MACLFDIRSFLRTDSTRLNVKIVAATENAVSRSVSLLYSICSSSYYYYDYIFLFWEALKISAFTLICTICCVQQKWRLLYDLNFMTKKYRKNLCWFWCVDAGAMFRLPPPLLIWPAMSLSSEIPVCPDSSIIFLAYFWHFEHNISIGLEKSVPVKTVNGIWTKGKICQIYLNPFIVQAYFSQTGFLCLSCHQMKKKNKKMFDLFIIVWKVFLATATVWARRHIHILFCGFAFDFEEFSCLSGKTLTYTNTFQWFFSLWIDLILLTSTRNKVSPSPELGSSMDFLSDPIYKEIEKKFMNISG